MPAHPATVALVDLLLHELRSPLNVALGSLRSIPTAELAPALATPVARASRACEHLARISTEVREWVRLQHEPPEVSSTPLSSALTDGIRRAEAIRGGGVRIAIDDDPEPLQVTAIGPRLADAFSSLALAVLRAAGDGAQVALRVSANQDGRIAIVRVGELGADPDAFDAARIGGLGFSLPLAEAIVERGGGHVRSALHDNRITGIEITLPLSGE